MRKNGGTNSPQNEKIESKEGEMIRNKIPLLIAIAVFVVSISCVWSQIRTRVEEVVVPVNVRDGDGKMVTGLTREDFVVTEDGQPQSISNFSADPMPLSAAIVVDDGMGGNA